jgi:RsiW-degrading membrane proteinase PrsW (M82 family)
VSDATAPWSVWSADDVEHLDQLRQPRFAAPLDRLTRRARTMVTAQRATASVALAFFLWRGLTFESVDGTFMKTVLAHGWVLLVVGAVGVVAGRTLPARRLLGFLLTGFFVIPVVVNVVMGPVNDWVGQGSRWASIGIVPPLEEVVKALPLLVLVYAVRRRPSTSASVLDFGLAGFALGAGFGIHEDLLYDRSLVMGFDGLGGLLVPSVVVDPLLVIGHGGWTALVGLGVGIAVVHRGRGPVWLAAVAGLAVAVADHAAANSAMLGDSFRGWVLDGWLALLMLAAGTAAAVASGVLVRRWAAARDTMFPPVPGASLLPLSPMALEAGEYCRLRAAVHTGAWRRAAPGHASAAAPQTAMLLAAAAGAAGLVIGPPVRPASPHVASSP